MGSKTPSPNCTLPTEPRDNCVTSFPAQPIEQPINRRLRLIAEALKISPIVLYGAPNAVIPQPQTDLHEADKLNRECMALADAYKRIRDPDERHRLLALIEVSADQA